MKKNLTITLIAIAIAMLSACFSIYSRKSVSVVFTGDILLDRGVKKVIEENGFDYPYKEVKNVLANADIAFANLECPVTDKGTPVLKRPYLIFRGAPDNILALKSAGYDILNLANNHIMDYSHQGLEDTIKNLKKSDIAYVGAGSDRQNAYQPVFVVKNGIKIGILSYSDFPAEGYVYSEKQSDIARTDEKMMKDCIEEAKGQCDFLIVSFHWGTEYNFYPGNIQIEYAHQAIDYGADLIIGHHPHVLQSVEKYNNKYIFYSLGNFVFDRQIYAGTDESVIFNTQIDKKGVEKIEILAVKIKNCQPIITKGDDALKTLEKIIQYSENKGADLKISGNKLIVNR